MELLSSADDISLVVRLQVGSDGTWFVSIDGFGPSQTFPIKPITLVVRLRRIRKIGALRGSIRLHGSKHWAPLQTNSQLAELVRAWLLGSASEKQ